MKSVVSVVLYCGGIFLSRVRALRRQEGVGVYKLGQREANLLKWGITDITDATDGTGTMVEQNCLLMPRCRFVSTALAWFWIGSSLSHQLIHGLNSLPG